MDEIKALLHKFDEKNCYEFPSDFDERDLDHRARAVFATLQAQGVFVAFENGVFVILTISDD